MSDILHHVSPELASYLVNVDDFEKVGTAGEGAFGKVYICNHTPTGKKCALKQLIATKLEDRDLLEFVREIEILVRCDSMFLMPFYGWTSSPPYSIAMEYISNGSVFQALRHRPQSPELTPTNKTIIMIGCAHAMASLHRIGIIHRDLKSMNVMLNDKLYPVITDFGISRFANSESTLMTQQIGTPHWMAPEVFSSDTYSNKVDVYAYAVLLWELLAESTPFKGYNGQQIMIAVCQKNERPMIPVKTPTKLRSLIQRCWDFDPTKRPSFEQICKVLDAKKVFFEGTDMDKVEMFIKELHADEEWRIQNKGQRKPPLQCFDSQRSIFSNQIPEDPQAPSNLDNIDVIAPEIPIIPYIDQNENKTPSPPQKKAIPPGSQPPYVPITNTVQMQAPSSTVHMKQPASYGDISPTQPPQTSLSPLSLHAPGSLPVISQLMDLSIRENVTRVLTNPQNPQYLDAVKQLRENCLNDDPNKFFNQLLPAMPDFVPEFITSRVLMEIRYMATLSAACLRAFLDSGIPNNLPFGRKEPTVVEQTMELMFVIVKNAPEYYTQTYILKLAPLISSAPHKVLRIIQELANLFDRLANPWPGVDFLIRASSPFLSSTAVPEFLSLLIQTLVNHRLFYENRLQNCYPIFLFTLSSDNHEVVKIGYNCICAFFNRELIIAPDILEQHIANGYEQEVISYLLLDRISPRTTTMIGKLLQIAPDNNAAFSVLVADAAKTENVDAFKPMLQVLLFGELRIDQKLLLVMTLLLHPSMRKHFAAMKDFIDFLVGMFETGRLDLFDPSSVIITKLLEFDSFVNNAKNMKMMQKYVDVAILIRKSSAARLAVYTIDCAARSGLIDEVSGSIKFIANLLTANGPNVEIALSALASMTGSHNCVQLMRELEVLQKVSPFLQSPYQRYANALQKELAN